jgi:hypothetical protein
MKLSRLPIDVVAIILSFDGRIKYRFGKFMNRLQKSDEKYICIKKFPRPFYRPKTSLFVFYSIIFFENTCEPHKQKRLDIYSYTDNFDEDNSDRKSREIVEYCYWYNMFSNYNNSDVYIRD